MSTFMQRALEPSVAAATPPAGGVVSGPRKCGKTTFLRNLVKTLEGEAPWMDCDSPSGPKELRFWSKSDTDYFLRLAANFVIDEAQRVPDIGLILKILVDANEAREKPSRIFVACSSPLEFAAGVKESALGRVKERRLWPFSMKELASVHGRGWVQENLDSLVLYGTYPMAVRDFEHAAEALADYAGGILFRDFFQAAELRRSGAFMRLAALLASRIGAEISYEPLGATLGSARQRLSATSTFSASAPSSGWSRHGPEIRDARLRRGKGLLHRSWGAQRADRRLFAAVIAPGRERHLGKLFLHVAGEEA